MAFLFGTETFEGGSPGQFDSVATSFGSGSIAIDANYKVFGVKSILVTVTGEYGGYAQEDLAASQSEMYFQMKGFLVSGFAFGVSGYTGFIQFQTTGGTPIMTGNIEDYGDVRFTMNNASSGYKDTSVNIPLNAAFTIEIRVKISATVGNFSVWLNNNVEGSPNYNSGNINTGTTNFQRILVGATYAPEAHSSWYFDHVTMDTAFIGARSLSSNTRAGVAIGSPMMFMERLKELIIPKGGVYVPTLQINERNFI